jgi:hypothetical protein
MAESNRRRLERLERLARVSVGNVQIDVGAAIAMEAEVLDAQIVAFGKVCKAYEGAGAWSAYGPERHRTAMQAHHLRFKLSEPLAIKARFKELQARVKTHGAGPAVHAVLARARAFVEGVA